MSLTITVTVGLTRISVRKYGSIVKKGFISLKTEHLYVLFITNIVNIPLLFNDCESHWPYSGGEYFCCYIRIMCIVLGTRVFNCLTEVANSAYWPTTREGEIKIVLLPESQWGPCTKQNTSNNAA